jgi:cell shape-determining protein MreD
MRDLIAIFIAGVILLLLQTTLFHNLPFLSKKIDLLAILAAYCGLYLDAAKASVLSLSLGYMMDTFCGGFLGLYGGLYLFISFVARLCCRHIMLKSAIHESGIAIFSILIAGLLFVLVLRGLFSGYSTLLSLLSVVLVQTFLTGIISPMLFPIFRRVSGHRGSIYDPIEGF